MALIGTSLKRFWAIAAIALLTGTTGCNDPEQPLLFQSIGLTSRSQSSLTYPLFLEDLRTAESYRQAGLQARQQDDLTSAIATLQTAVALAPRTVTGYVILGWTQHLAGQHEAAIATLQEGLAQDAEHVPALNALGIAYLVNGDLNEAIATHTQAKMLQADNEIAYYNLSLAYQRLPDLAEAIDHATRATELEPYNPHPWVALALAQWTQQDTDAAQTAYREALSLDSRYFEAYHLDHLTQAGFSPDQIQTVEQIRMAVL